MKSQFPLYNSLYKDLPDKDLKIADKKKFISHIKKIDQKGYDLIYTLIKVYYLNNEIDTTIYTIPYGGKFINKDLIFDLNEIPIKLRQLLYKFLNMHIEKMKENKL